jgi:hypothetical protein
MPTLISGLWYTSSGLKSKLKKWQFTFNNTYSNNQATIQWIDYMRQCRQKKTCLIKSHYKGATKIPEVKAVQLLQLPVQLSGWRPKRSSLPCTSPGTGRRIGDVWTGRS